MAHTIIPVTQEAQTGRSEVGDKFRQLSESPSQKNNKNRNTGDVVEPLLTC